MWKRPGKAQGEWREGGWGCRAPVQTLPRSFGGPALPGPVPGTTASPGMQDCPQGWVQPLAEDETLW